MFDPKKPVQTRDGRSVRILATDLSLEDGGAIAAVVQERANLYRFQADGRRRDDAETPDDLVNIPEKIVRYVNVYDAAQMGLHPSAEEADRVARYCSSRPVARIRVEFTEGQFDE